MDTNVYSGAVPRRTNALGMTSFDQAMADMHMQEAMMLADLTLSAAQRVRRFSAGVGKLLGLAFLHKRDYVRDGVTHFD